MSQLFKYFLFTMLFSVAVKAIEVPQLTGPVMDEVGILNSSIKTQLDQNIRAYYKSTGVQLQVYIIKSLEGDAIESIAIQVFDKWKLGDEKTDKGLLFLVAPNEKRLRIEVGQGLEGDLPDVIAKRIISDVVVPYFKRGEYSVGVLQGVSSIQNYISNVDAEQKAAIQETEKGHSKKSNFWFFAVLAGLWLIIFLFNPSFAIHILFAMLSGGRGGGYGGGSGGGSWSGGGGRSSGGGASGSW